MQSGKSNLDYRFFLPKYSLNYSKNLTTKIPIKQPNPKKSIYQSTMAITKEKMIKIQYLNPHKNTDVKKSFLSL